MFRRIYKFPGLMKRSLFKQISDHTNVQKKRKKTYLYFPGEEKFPHLEMNMETFSYFIGWFYFLN